MSLLDKQWRSLEELDEYAMAMGKGRRQTPRQSPVKENKKEKEGADRDEVELKPHPFFNPWVFLVLTCCGNIAYISAIGGYVSASLSTIERRFQLKSSQSGAITIINDIAGMMAVLFITHFGHSRHRPRIVGAALAFVGLGTIMCALPHFIYDPPPAMMQKMSGLSVTNDTTSTTGDMATCMVAEGQDPLEPGDEQCDASEKATSGSLVWQIGWILIGQVLCGLGTCAQPLCITYLDDNVKNKRTTTIFVGIIFSSFAFGPTLGYMLATACLSRPSFFYDPSVPPPVVSQDHPYYIGAWWAGFIVNGAVLLLVSVPFFFFPKSMRKEVEVEDADMVEMEKLMEKNKEETDVGLTSMIPSTRGRQGNDKGIRSFLTDFLQTVKRIVTNLTAMSVYFAICAEISGHVGWFVFGPKFMYTQFRLPPAKSSMLFGMMMLPGPIIGNILAGVVVKRFKLDSKGCAKLVIGIESSLMFLAPLLYWLGCDNPLNAGLTTPYSVNSNGDAYPFTSAPAQYYADDLTASCNVDCGCAPDFVPVCGSDGLTYATACHAGCKEYTTVDMGNTNSTLFVDCSCIPEPTDNSTFIVGLEEMLTGFAFEGECPWFCDKLYYFLGMMLFGSLVGSMLHNPSFMLQFRSHREEDRSTALGVSNVLMKLIALIPGPIYFGAILEKTCILFQESCGKTGNCLVYDIKAFRLVFTLFMSCGRVIALCLFCVAYFSIRKRKKEEDGFIAMHPISSKYNAKMEKGHTDFKHTTV